MNLILSVSDVLEELLDNLSGGLMNMFSDFRKMQELVLKTPNVRFSSSDSRATECG